MDRFVIKINNKDGNDTNDANNDANNNDDLLNTSEWIHAWKRMCNCHAYYK